MSRWDYGGWYKPAPKRPPPQRGIKMRKAGSTWWGQRWVEALERMSLGYSSRLARGRTYARAGRTHDLVVKAGEVTAKVTGSRAAPYKVRIALAEGKTHGDKRESLKEREHKREMDRIRKGDRE